MPGVLLLFKRLNPLPTRPIKQWPRPSTTRIHRVAGLTGDRTAVITTHPCHSLHQTISDVGLIGRGHVPMPGEVSLAHHGVLFLDEFPSAATISWRFCDNRWKRVSYTYNFADVLNLHAFVALATRLMTSVGLGRGR